MTAITALMFAALGLAAGTDAESARGLRAAAARVAPCVVTIETVGGAQPASNAAGATPFIVADGPTTGVIWSADGLIVTSSFNFVRAPSVITVILSDGRRLVGELLARDEIRRLAMLKVQAQGLPTALWAGPDDLHVGASAVSLGRGHGPLAGADAEHLAGCTLTAGIISGLRRMSGLVVQTDAKLSPANFGGPLIDLQGRVIGLCVPMGMGSGELSGVEWYDSGIGFAVPRWQVELSARELADGHNIRRGLLGIGVNPAMIDAVVVTGVGDPSPAIRAGIQPGDRILSIDDTPVQNFLALTRALRPRAAGTQAVIRLDRAGERLELPLVLATPADIGPFPRSTSGTGPRPATAPDRDEDQPVLPPSSGPS